MTILIASNFGHFGLQGAATAAASMSTLVPFLFFATNFAAASALQIAAMTALIASPSIFHSGSKQNWENIKEDLKRFYHDISHTDKPSVTSEKTLPPITEVSRGPHQRIRKVRDLILTDRSNTLHRDKDHRDSSQVKQFNSGITDVAPSFPSSVPLVGIELNPGPKRSKNKVQKQKQKGNSVTSRVNAFVSAVAPIANSSVVRPVLRFGGVQRMIGHGLVMRGSQQLGILWAYANRVSFSSGAATNRFMLDPSFCPAPLSDIAKSFLRFQFRSVTFRYVPSCSTSNAGTVILAYTTDANTYTATPADDDMRRMGNSLETPVWSGASLKADLDLSAILYQFNTGVTGSDLHFCDQGALLFGGYSALANGTGLGGLYMDYELELFELGTVANIQFLSLLKEEKLEKQRQERELYAKRLLEFEEKDSKERWVSIPATSLRR